MNNNPFLYGAPISNKSRFVGRDSEINQVLSRLRNDGFESSSIIGARRIGKTSLINRLKEEVLSSDCWEKICAINLDLPMLATPEDFWKQMLKQLGQTPLPFKALNSSVANFLKSTDIETSALTDLFAELGNANVSIVLFLDEFDQVTLNPNFDVGFFSKLRSLAIHHRLAIVTSSHADLYTLTHSKELEASQFFNIFATIHLGPFNSEETDSFFEQYLAGTGIRFQEGEKTSLCYGAFRDWLGRLGWKA